MIRVPYAELPRLAGTRLGESGWHAITQLEIDAFADATGDRQWIHVDPERAAAGPFGRTIAHGYLTLALAPRLLDEILEVEDTELSLNYGIDRVRFAAPVPVGSEIRAVADLLAAHDVDGGVQASLRLVVELRGEAKPACVAEVVFRYLGRVRAP